MGDVVWFEVMGKNSDALKGFYGQLFGWQFAAAPGAEGYGLVNPSGKGIPGGVGPAPKGPGWTTFYVEVEDIEAALAKATSLGATAMMPPTRLPDGGIISMVTDPEGHPVGLVQSPAA